MDSNYKDFPQSLKTPNQSPLDGKTMVYTLDALKDLGPDNYKAFTYYRGLIINCLEDGEWYQWTDQFESDDVKILEEDFIYPSDIVFGGFNYSDLAFNFKKILKNGKDGAPGRDGKDGKDGKDGVSPEPIPHQYTWTLYADDNQGTNMSKYPAKEDGTFREWIGYAYNKESIDPMFDYSLYTWAKYVGKDGIPGESGYMWIKYSMYNNGRDYANRPQLSEAPYDESIDEWMSYMGVAYNKEEKQESDIPEDYTWSKIKGNDGSTSYVLNTTNDVINIPADSDGNLMTYSLQNANTEIQLFHGNDIIPITDYVLTFEKVGVFEYTSERLGDSYKISITSITDENCSLVISATKEDQSLLVKSSINILMIKSLETYEIKGDINVIKVLGDGSIENNGLLFKVYKNTGNDYYQTTDGTLRWKYNTDNTSGTIIPPNGKITLSNTNNPAFITLTYHDENNVLRDTETVPFVRDGRPGADGPKGEKGEDGKPGKDGLNGTSGPLSFQYEWTEGATYYNNATQKDYIYHRDSNKVYSVKDESAIAGATPNLTYFKEEPFDPLVMFRTIIAEGGNIAGFIFRNQQMFSQAGLLDSVTQNLIPNMLLNGSSGFIDFLNKFRINSDGIVFTDPEATSENKKRLALEFINGIPVLRMWHPNGNLGIEMGIIKGKLTLSFYSEEGFLVYSLGDKGIVYENYIGPSTGVVQTIDVTGRVSSSSTDAEIVAEFKSYIETTRIPVNDGPENKYQQIEFKTRRHGSYMRYYAGNNEDASQNKQYEQFAYKSVSVSSPQSGTKFTGVVINTNLSGYTFSGTRAYEPYSEIGYGYTKTNPRRDGYMTYYEGVEEEITLLEYVNGVVSKIKTVKSLIKL